MKRVLLGDRSAALLDSAAGGLQKERRYHLDPRRGKHTRDCGGDPRPTELPPYEANVLTGEPKGADYPRASASPP